MIPEECKSCVYRYNDIAEGQNCNHPKYAYITLSSGTRIAWSINVDKAITRCKVKGYQKRPLGKLNYWMGM